MAEERLTSASPAGRSVVDVRAELEQIKALDAPQRSITIVSANSTFIQMVIARTPYSKVNCRLTFPENYPANVNPLIVEVSSNVLGSKLVEKAEKIGKEEVRFMR
ncbi:unnamed protein product [Heterosigma akashiwo]